MLTTASQTFLSPTKDVDWLWRKDPTSKWPVIFSMHSNSSLLATKEFNVSDHQVLEYTIKPNC